MNFIKRRLFSGDRGNKSSQPVFLARNSSHRHPSLRGIVLALGLALPIAVEAQYSYTTNNGTITIVQYTGSDPSVTIPDTITGLPVTTIGTQAFATSSSLTNVIIPDSVIDIGVGAFSDCTSLLSVTFGNNVANIEDQAFFDCSSLANVTIPNSVTNIGYKAFYECGLTTLSIPGNVQTLGKQSFSFCGLLSNVTIPASVTNIGDLAFDSCGNLAGISVDPSNPAYSSLAGVLFDKNQTSLIQCPGAASGTYTVPNGVTSIGGSAFRNCNRLTSVRITGAVTNIGDYAFGTCTSLSAITVSTINLFYSTVGGVLFDKAQSILIQCPGALTGTYSLPDTVTEIRSTAFIGCRKLAAISVGSRNQSFSSLGGVLFDKAQGTLIQCPAALTGGFAIPNGVTNIGNYAFVVCAGLTNVTIPPSVSTIGIGAFSECTGLTNVVIPMSVTSIATEAFEGCTHLTKVTIPDSITDIGLYAFADCQNLASVTIPNSVTNIEERAFQDCSGLTNVTIGNNLRNLGTLVFAFCPSLTGIYFRGDALSADSAVFQGDNAIVYYVSGTAGWGPTFGGLPTALWNPTALGVAGLQAQNKIYDSTTNASLIVSVATLVGLMSGDKVTLNTINTTGAFSDKTAATAKPVTVTGLSLLGPDAPKYALTPLTVKADISPAVLTVIGVSASDKTYDGDTAATLSTSNTTLIGALSGDIVGLDSTGALGAFTDPNAGTAKTVLVSGLVINGTDVANYGLTQPTTTANILPADPFVSAWPTASPITYGQTLADSSLSGGTTGILAFTTSVSGTFAFTTPALAPPAGTAMQSVTFFPIDTTNYNTLTGSASLTVNPAGSITALISSQNPALVGSNVSFTVTVQPGGSATTMPAGSVQFYSNGTSLGSSMPLSNGVVSLQTSGLPLGTNVIMAVYHSDGNFLDSSNSLSQVVQTVAALPKAISIQNNDGATVLVTFSGTPGAQYLVQASDIVAMPTWENVSTNMAGPDGQWTFIESKDGHSARFYRAALP
jgi:hypothetical protein